MHRGLLALWLLASCKTPTALSTAATATLRSTSVLAADPPPVVFSNVTAWAPVTEERLDALIEAAPSELASRPVQTLETWELLAPLPLEATGAPQSRNDALGAALGAWADARKTSTSSAAECVARQFSWWHLHHPGRAPPRPVVQFIVGRCGLLARGAFTVERRLFESTGQASAAELARQFKREWGRAPAAQGIWAVGAAQLGKKVALSLLRIDRESRVKLDPFSLVANDDELVEITGTLPPDNDDVDAVVRTGLTTVDCDHAPEGAHGFRVTCPVVCCGEHTTIKLTAARESFSFAVLPKRAPASRFEPPDSQAQTLLGAVHETRRCVSTEPVTVSVAQSARLDAALPAFARYLSASAAGTGEMLSAFSAGWLLEERVWWGETIIGQAADPTSLARQVGLDPSERRTMQVPWPLVVASSTLTTESGVIGAVSVFRKVEPPLGAASDAFDALQAAHGPPLERLSLHGSESLFAESLDAGLSLEEAAKKVQGQLRAKLGRRSQAWVVELRAPDELALPEALTQRGSFELLLQAGSRRVAPDPWYRHVYLLIVPEAQ